MSVFDNTSWGIGQPLAYNFNVFRGNFDYLCNTLPIAASRITGVLDIANIPPAAIEKLTKVANQAARFALTIDSVQNGDTVQQMDTGEMYYVYDSANLGNENGYVKYTAGTASACPWTGITGKPTTLAGYGIAANDTLFDAKYAPGGCGLGNSTVTPGIDAHSLKYTGMYYLYNSTNVPEDYAAIWVNGNGSDCSQIAAGVTTGKAYINACNSGTWLGWKQLATTDSPVFTNNINITGTYPYLQITPSSGTGTSIIQAGVDIVGGGAGNFTSFLNPANKGYSFAIGGVAKVVIDTNGNVGINHTGYTNSKMTIKEDASGGFGLTMLNRDETQAWGMVVDTNTIGDKILGFFDRTNNRIPLVLSGDCAGLGGVTNPQASLHSGGTTILGNATIQTWEPIGNQQTGFCITEAGNTLNFLVKTSTGECHLVNINYLTGAITIG